MTPPLKTTAEQRAELTSLWVTIAVPHEPSFRLLKAYNCLAFGLAVDLATDVEILFAANKALEDENATYKAGCHNAILAWEIITEECDQLEQALKRAGEVTDERVEAAAAALYQNEKRRSEGAQRILQKASGKPCNGIAIEPFEENKSCWLDDGRAALTAALVIQPKGDGDDS